MCPILCSAELIYFTRFLDKVRGSVCSIENLHMFKTIDGYAWLTSQLFLNSVLGGD